MTLNPPAVSAHGDLAMFRWDSEMALARTGVPVLVVGGERDIVTKPEASRAIAAARQPLSRIRVKFAPEIGTREIILAAGREARHALRFQTESGEALHQTCHIESRVYGVACARMVEGKFEQRLGRQARAGTPQRHARRRKLAQSFKRRQRFRLGEITRQERRPRATARNSSTHFAGRKRPRART